MNEGDGASVPSGALRGASVGWVNGDPVWSSADGRCWPMDPCDASEILNLCDAGEIRAATVDWTQLRLQDGEDERCVEDREGREFPIECDVDEDRVDPEDDQGEDLT